MDELFDLCLLKGLCIILDGFLIKDILLKELVLLGIGKFEECLKRIYFLLGKDEFCEDDLCLFNG